MILNSTPFIYILNYLLHYPFIMEVMMIHQQTYNLANFGYNLYSTFDLSPSKIDLTLISQVYIFYYLVYTYYIGSKKQFRLNFTMSNCLFRFRFSYPLSHNFSSGIKVFQEIKIVFQKHITKIVS
jgi:hypothetical protein